MRTEGKRGKYMKWAVRVSVAGSNPNPFCLFQSRLHLAARVIVCLNFKALPLQSGEKKSSSTADNIVKNKSPSNSYFPPAQPRNNLWTFHLRSTPQRFPAEDASRVPESALGPRPPFCPRFTLLTSCLIGAPLWLPLSH